MKTKNNRLEFIRKVTGAVGSMALVSALPVSVFAAVKKEPAQLMKDKRIAPRIKFAVIGINHGHIHTQIDLIIKGGGTLVSFYAKEPGLAAEFLKKYPDVILARNEKEILEDRSVQLVLCAAIPDERAAIGIAAMLHGKDFLVDKPAVTTLDQLAEVRKTQKRTGKIFAVLFGRLENRGTIKALELVAAGAIGKVIQTISLAPHRVNPSSRPEWFWDGKHYGGIINDIGSHQFDEFLAFTGSSTAEILASQVANINHPQHPGFQDFGDVMLAGNKGTGYMRLDWFTPDGLKSWGDDRITVLGTDGYIEVRKNIDLAGREGGNHVLLVDHQATRHFDCTNHTLPFGNLFVDDIINRTSTSINQEQTFLATELALRAQLQARITRLV